LDERITKALGLLQNQREAHAARVTLSASTALVVRSRHSYHNKDTQHGSLSGLLRRCDLTSERAEVQVNAELPKFMAEIRA